MPSSVWPFPALIREAGLNQLQAGSVSGFLDRQNKPPAGRCTSGPVFTEHRLAALFPALQTAQVRMRFWISRENIGLYSCCLDQLLQNLDSCKCHNKNKFDLDFSTKCCHDLHWDSS